MNNNNAWVWWLIGVIIVAVGGYLISQNTSAPSSGTNDVVIDISGNTATSGVAGTDNNTGSSTTSVGEAAGVSVQVYAMESVATHNSASSCWSVIDSNVYDLTSWIPQHPGGARAITGLCGKDGTAAFHGQHSDAKKQADLLATMKIGVLAQ